MKATLRFTSLIIIVYLHSYCKAQTPSQWISYQQHELKECPFIFEGKIIEQSELDKTTSVCSVIQITKILKGEEQLKLGTIKVITEQSTKYQKIIDAPPGLHNGYTYIIFGHASNSTSFQTLSADNSLTLWCNDWISFIGIGAEWGWRKKTHYNSTDSVYSFFKENGLTIQEEVPTADNTKH